MINCLVRSLRSAWPSMRRGLGVIVALCARMRGVCSLSCTVSCCLGVPLVPRGWCKCAAFPARASALRASVAHGIRALSRHDQDTPAHAQRPQHQAALRVSTKQIAKDAVRGGPKSVKKDKRPTGHGQKG